MARRQTRPSRRARGGRGRRGSRSTANNSDNNSDNNSPDNRTSTDTASRDSRGRLRAGWYSPGESVPVTGSGLREMIPNTENSRDSLCSICHGIISNLCITNCNHMFCRDCITRWTRANINCPNCRQVIHTIRHILPNGGTEIIQISRAELMAHKVREIYGILMLLFTVMTHSMLPEVNNYLEQLDQIANDLNVATTLTRLRHAASEQPPQSSPNSATSASSRPTSPVERPAGSTGISPPATLIIRARNVVGSINPGSTPNSRQQVNLGDDLLLRQMLSMSPPTSPSRSRPTSASSSPAASGAVSQAARSASAPTPTPAPVASSSAPSATRMAGATGGSATSDSSPAQTSLARPATPSVAPQANSAEAQSAQRSSNALGSSSLTSNQARVSEAAHIRAGSQSSTPEARPPTLLQTSLTGQQPNVVTSNRDRRPSTTSGSSHDRRNLVNYESNPFITHTYENSRVQQRGQPEGSLNRRERSRSVSPRAPSSRGMSYPSGLRGPTAQEAQRTQDQRDRDIAFLVDSYNKINQVREVLLITHMVIHRNQVELELPASREADPPSSPGGSVISL